MNNDARFNPQDVRDFLGPAFCEVFDESKIDIQSWSLGFSESEQKWYGWSHRAIFDFGIGSKTKKGNCGYVAATPEELIEDHVAFHADIETMKKAFPSTDRNNSGRARLARDECQILPDRSGIRVLPAPLKIPMADDMDDLMDSLDSDIDLPEVDINENAWYEIKCGRGEWTAETLDDAKQMALDFAEGVS